MNNLNQPIFNKEAVITQGDTIILVPNDFEQYDELWAHVRVQGVTGSPSAATLKATWQIEHPQDSGGTHDSNPTYIDLNTFNNGHLLHGGVDWPFYLSNAASPSATFSPYIEYIRGIKLQTPRIRLRFTANFTGGTNPAYTISVAYHMKRSSSESRPFLNVQSDSGSAGRSKIRDVWGYTIHNKDASTPCVVEYRNDYTITNGALKDVIVVEPNSSKTFYYDKPIRYGSGLYLGVTAGAGGATVLTYTTDNLTV